MLSAQIAFKDFYASKGIWGSQWVGMKYFKRFFHSYQFWPLIRNTLSLSFLQIAVGFPAPIILAILLNQMKNQRFKQFVQTVTYCPHFISIVVLTGPFSAKRAYKQPDCFFGRGTKVLSRRARMVSPHLCAVRSMAKRRMERHHLHSGPGGDQLGSL